MLTPSRNDPASSAAMHSILKSPIFDPVGVGGFPGGGGGGGSPFASSWEGFASLGGHDDGLDGMGHGMGLPGLGGMNGGGGRMTHAMMAPGMGLGMGLGGALEPSPMGDHSLGGMGFGMHDQHGLLPGGDLDGKPLPEEVAYYKTALCDFFSRGVLCPKGARCLYAHGKEELRTYKTGLCREFEARGKCRRGDDCLYAHGREELRQRQGITTPLPPPNEGHKRKRSDFDMLIVLGHTIDENTSLGCKVRLREALKAAVMMSADSHQSHSNSHGNGNGHGGLGAGPQRRPSPRGLTAVQACSFVLCQMDSLRLDHNFNVSPKTILAFATIFPRVFQVHLQAQRISLAPQAAHQGVVGEDVKLERMLNMMGLSQFAPAFRDAGVDYSTLLIMQQSDMDALVSVPESVRHALVDVLGLQ